MTASTVERPDKKIKEYVGRSRRIQKAAAAAGLITGVLAGVYQNAGTEIAGAITVGGAILTAELRRGSTEKFVTRAVATYASELEKITHTTYPVNLRSEWSIDSDTNSLTRKQTVDTRIDVNKYDTGLKAITALLVPATAYSVGHVAGVELGGADYALPAVVAAGAVMGSLAAYGAVIGDKYYQNIDEIAGYMLDNIEGVGFTSDKD